MLENWRKKNEKIGAVAGQRSSPESCFANKTKMFFRAKLKKRQITGPFYTDSFSKSMTFIHQIQRYKAKSVDNEIKVTVIYIYFEVKHQVILTHNPKVWCSYII